MYSIIFRNQLLANIETPSVHLVQFQLEEAVALRMKYVALSAKHSAITLTEIVMTYVLHTCLMAVAKARYQNR